MPRHPRDNTPGSIVHIISNFVDRDWLLTCDEERATYLRLLEHALKHTDWLLLAYALMSSHLHLQLLVGLAPMEALTRRANSPFAHWLNERHGRLGPVFAGRPKDYEFTADRSGQLTAYIHNNPVRAGVVEKAIDSTWTSHRYYAGIEPAPPWLRVDEGLRLAGFTDGRTFDEWVNITPGERHDSTIDKHRRVVRRRGALEMATPRVGTDGREIPLVKRPYGHVRTDPETLVRVVSDVVGIEAAMIASRQRRRELVDARRVVITIGRTLGLTLSELAAALGISVQAIAKAERQPLSCASVRTRDVVLQLFQSAAAPLRR